MLATATTLAFHSIYGIEVAVQVQVAPGLPIFTIVGLPDKSVGESRERIRAALGSLSIGLPPKRIIVNLAPANVPKEGSHFDLPIALSIIAALDIIPPESLSKHLIIGELGLDGSVAAVEGVVSAGIMALRNDLTLMCPFVSGGEAMLASKSLDIAPVATLLEACAYLRGDSQLPQPPALSLVNSNTMHDMQEIRGQETARRGLEVAAAGGHNMIMSGPPGAGKSMLAKRLPGILPPLSDEEAMEVRLIASVSGNINKEGFATNRPFRSPHHSASMPALVGGGSKAKPGEITLAHCGVLFLDELPEFSPRVLDALRQPIETGEVTLSRANSRITWPATFQLIAAMNPCRCGYALDPNYNCKVGKNCAARYQARISGPLMDRIDIRLEIPALDIEELGDERKGESSNKIAQRVANARNIQMQRYRELGRQSKHIEGFPIISTNAQASNEYLDKVANISQSGLALLTRSAKLMNITARGYFRVIKVARTIADLAGDPQVQDEHIAESLAFRGANVS